MAALDFPCFEVHEDVAIWRYMNTDAFRRILGGTLHFAAASQFDDAFEGAITDAEYAWRKEHIVPSWGDENEVEPRYLRYLEESFAALRKLTKVSCWHASPIESATMWQQLSSSNVRRTIAIKSSTESLKRSLRDFRLEPQFGAETIRVGQVTYIDYAADRMSNSSMESVFMYKRHEFRDEREIRAVLSLRMAEEFGVSVPPLGVDVEIDVANLVQEVRISSQVDDNEAEIFQAVLLATGSEVEVRRSSLASTPRY